MWFEIVQGASQCITKCISNGADKEDIFFIFAQRHYLYINVVRKYMKYIPLLMVMLNSLAAYGQVDYRLFIKDKCDGKIESAFLYNVKNGDSILSPIDTTGLIPLRTKTRYTLYSMYFSDTIQLYFENPKVTADTLFSERIVECLAPIPDPTFSGYCCCGLNKCDGYEVDYYNNGKVRIEGTFKKGKPVGTLKTFDQNGQLVSVKRYSKNGRQKNR